MPQSFNPWESISHPDRSTSPSSFQGLGSLDLFNNLLFSREKVYKGLKRLSPLGTSFVKEESVQPRSIAGQEYVVPSIEVKEEDTMPPKRKSLNSNLGPVKKKVSKLQGKSTKKAPAKSAPKRKSSVTVKKRSPPAPRKSERAARIQKNVPKANSGKRVNGRGANMADAFVIPDEEDGSGQFSQRSRTDSLTPPQPMVKMETLDSVDDLKPTPTSTLASARRTTLKISPTRLADVHAQQLDRLHDQLRASEAQVQHAREQAAQEALDFHRRQSIEGNKALADFRDELESERSHSIELAWENAHLRTQLEEARSCLNAEIELAKQRDLASSTASPLSTAFPLSSSSPPSSTRPSPSISTQDHEQRAQNLRRAYVTLKKRYDNLSAAGYHIATAFRGMNTDAFGEVGRYLRVLRGVLEGGKGGECDGGGEGVGKVEEMGGGKVE